MDFDYDSRNRRNKETSACSSSGGLEGRRLTASPEPFTHYGEPFVDEHVNSSSFLSARYTFSGKERDEETGYSNFGARYLDATLLTSWFSVDPMADKYPSLSPYNYCAWNPIKLVDPDGRDVWELVSATGEFRKIEESDHDEIRIIDAEGEVLSYFICNTKIVTKEYFIFSYDEED